MLISILIPTLIARRQTFNLMVEKLHRQIENNNLKKKVEILVICDDRTLKLSEKRNMLQSLANGKYFMHLDDDDNLSDDYCVKLVDHIENKIPTEMDGDPDVIAYDQKAFVNSGVFIVKPSMNHGFRLEEAPANSGGLKEYREFYRFPWQWCLWNTEKYRKIYRTDSDTNAREDQNWLKKILLEYPSHMSYVTNYIGHEYHFEDPSKSTCQ
jgi:hypothetical protein